MPPDTTHDTGKKELTMTPWLYSKFPNNNVSFSFMFAYLDNSIQTVPH